MKLTTSVGLAILLFQASPLQAIDNEPHGIGDAAFGMSIDEVKKHFPKVSPMVENQQELAYYTAGAKIPYKGLKSCKGVFLFFNNSFYQVAFDCSPRSAVEKVLTDEFGAPTTHCGGKNKHQTWVGEKSTVQMNCVNKGFNFGDNAMVAKAQAYIKHQQLKVRKKAAEGSATSGKKAAKKPAGKAD